ncbi:dTDP-3-amino-3,6-dideoxy-alpha-D-glucopyranose N,N-dimethyltransferase [Andreprevotia sp. IGB-42]|uniref:class I SAM-dependent DNA methyltransferase n=1 Tax=Andreprevotia sp. IGB-42 TaxID=2497473 RepID=UPI001358B911|nr:class I SAM-dependent methyltransferase [Andreprevotia sp. IGB-42]KAF0811506.1 dTDP-3-amino-3,6-dideoxy-alpha-D-glucopyranose N,N-dimethyltransferase [Andreprevotia sp. IGB-42]
MSIFDRYARYYDLLYREKDYRGEADFIISRLKTYFPQASTILELGCGTGIHAQVLAEAGYKVHGIDISANMLAAAEQRKRDLPQEISNRLTFSQADLGSFSTSRKFDIVLSLFHVFSYQTSNQALHAAFDTANKHLVNNGILVFDYWYGPAVLSMKPETRVKRLQDGGLSIIRIAESTIDYQKNTVNVQYEIMMTEQDSVEVVKESHLMRYLFAPEVEYMASMHNFSLLSHGVLMQESAPSENSWAAYSTFRLIP